MQRKTLVSLYALANYFDRQGQVHLGDRIDRILRGLAQNRSLYKAAADLSIFTPKKHRGPSVPGKKRTGKLTPDSELLDLIPDELLHGLALTFSPDDASEDKLKDLQRLTNDPKDWSPDDKAAAKDMLRDHLEEARFELYDVLPPQLTASEEAMTEGLGAPLPTEGHQKTKYKPLEEDPATTKKKEDKPLEAMATPYLTFTLLGLRSKGDPELRKLWPKKLLDALYTNRSFFERRWSIARQKELKPKKKSLYDIPLARPEDLSSKEESTFDALTGILAHSWMRYQPNPRTFEQNAKDLKNEASPPYEHMGYAAELFERPRRFKQHAKGRGWEKSVPQEVVRVISAIATRMIEENREGESWSYKRIQTELEELFNDQVLITPSDFSKFMGITSSEYVMDYAPARQWFGSAQNRNETHQKWERKYPGIYAKLLRIEKIYLALVSKNEVVESVGTSATIVDIDIAVDNLVTAYDKWKKADALYNKLRQIKDTSPGHISELEDSKADLTEKRTKLSQEEKIVDGYIATHQDLL